MGINLLAAEAELAARGREDEEPDFVLSLRDDYFRRITKEAEAQEVFGQEVAAKLLRDF